MPKLESRGKPPGKGAHDRGTPAGIARAQPTPPDGDDDRGNVHAEPMEERDVDGNTARVYETMGKTKEAADLYFNIASNKDIRSTAVGNNAVSRLTVLAPEKADQLPAAEPTSPFANLGGLGGSPIQVR